MSTMVYKIIEKDKQGKVDSLMVAISFSSLFDVIAE